MSFKDTGYILTVKASQLEPAITGTLYQATYYVDPTEKFIYGGDLVGINYDNTTLISAHNNDVQAAGICYKTSMIDRYGRLDNFDSEEKLYAYGPREDEAIGLCKEGVITISKDGNTRHQHFYTGNVNGVSVFTCHPGQIIKDGGTTYHVIYNDGTKVIALDDAGVPKEYTSGNVNAVGMLDKTLYLANTGMTDCQLPFTSYKPVGAGKVVQPVGKVESNIAVRINLKHYDVKVN
jgi:hypothetical protein